ncbi:hypothetical protein V6N13_114715 [Hibiscus sabdariffa]
MPRQRSGQIFVEALAPCASLWELVLNDLIDDFVEVPGVCHEGTVGMNLGMYHLSWQKVGQDICRDRNLGMHMGM